VEEFYGIGTKTPSKKLQKPLVASKGEVKEKTPLVVMTLPACIREGVT
jgi:hypothetical protein